MNGTVNSRYLLLTLLLIVALIGYFAFSHYLAGPRANKANAQTSISDPQPTTTAPLPPDPTEPSQRPIWLSVGAILVAAGILTFVVARLQKRRSEAYRKAATEQRDKPAPNKTL